MNRALQLFLAYKTTIKSYYCFYNDPKFILMEDVAIENYQNNWRIYLDEYKDKEK